MTTDRQAAISAIGAFVDDYVEFYALDDGECYHEPTEHERFLIEDAINGLIADGEFEALVAAPITAERDALRAEVERLRADNNRLNIAVAEAVPAVRAYAYRNPRHEYEGVMQDPCGAHGWLDRNGAARAAQEGKT